MATDEEKRIYNQALEDFREKVFRFYLEVPRVVSKDMNSIFEELKKEVKNE